MAVMADAGGGGGSGAVLYCDYDGVHGLEQRVISDAAPVGTASSSLISSCMDAVTAAGQFGAQLGPGAEAFSNDFGKGLPGLQENFDGQAAFLNIIVQSLSWTDTTLARAATPTAAPPEQVPTPTPTQAPTSAGPSSPSPTPSPAPSPTPTPMPTPSATP